MEMTEDTKMEGLKENMTRKERREWYRQNKNRLHLPSWGELQKLTENYERNNSASV